MGTSNILRSLMPNEKDFLRTEQITSEKTPSDWISFLKKTLVFDKQADSSRKKMMALLIISLILVPISWIFVFSAVAAVIPTDYQIISLFLAFVAGFLIFAISVFAFVKYFRLKRFDIKCSDSIKNKVLPVVFLLREEVRPTGKIKLRLDLRKPTHPDKFVKTTPAYSKGAYYKVVDSDYRNNWLNGETYLADGTFLKWNISDLIRETKKTKVNQTGKYKRKSKIKNRTFISLQVGVERGKFKLPSRLKEKGDEGKIRTKKLGKYDWIQIERTFKLGPSEFQVKYFIDTVASAYMRAKPIKTG